MLRIFLSLCFLFTLFNGRAQTSKTVRLKATSGRIKLYHFFISKVADDREDTAGIGTMRSGMLNKPASVVLENGTAAAISNFIRDNVQQDPSSDSIELHILKLQVSESATTFREKAELSAQIGFCRKGTKIIDYTGNYSAQSGRDVSGYIGKLVSQSIEGILKEFDGWWPANRAQYDDSRKDIITVKAELKDKGFDPDQIVFNSERPLSIADFEAAPDKLSIALAATYSGIALQYEVQGDNTGTRVRAEITPYFDKTKSWMKKAGQTPYVLRHEQVHFYITAIKAYELMRAIKGYRFTAEGIKEEIGRLHKQYSKETEAMQAQYDEETAHGTIKEKQRLWESRIVAELAEQAATAGN